MKPLSSTKRVILQDIADATGYTVNTVSRALKNKSDISKVTCEHIQKIADEMGYVRNSIASSLRSGQTRTLAVVVGGVSNPFYATMIDTIHDLAEKLGYTVMVLCSRDNEQQEQQSIITAISRQADGILLFPGFHAASSIALMKQAGIPFVLVSRRTNDPECDSVVCDEETGGYLAGKHLIEAGHRKLVFFFAFHVLYSSEQRCHGLARAAQEAGIPPEDVLYYHNINESDSLKNLTQWRKDGFTGIFMFCDMEAWQLIATLDAHHMTKDFAFIGFDNIQSMIGFPTPLCTIDASMQEVTKAATELLLRRIRGDRSAPQHLVFPARVVCRGSCGHPVCEQRPV